MPQTKLGEQLEIRSWLQLNLILVRVTSAKGAAKPSRVAAHQCIWIFYYESVQWMISHFLSAMCIYYMRVSLNGGTPKTPQNDHF